MYQRQQVTEEQLLKVANERIKQRPGYVAGMQFAHAERIDGIMVLSGPGIPTDNKYFRDLGIELGEDYDIVPA
jgi:hypothetical protein